MTTKRVAKDKAEGRRLYRPRKDKGKKNERVQTKED